MDGQEKCECGHLRREHAAGDVAGITVCLGADLACACNAFALRPTERPRTEVLAMACDAIAEDRGGNSEEEAYDAEMMRLAAKRLRDLDQWKREATTVLAEWEKVWEAAGKPGRLGSSKAESVLRTISPTPPTGAP